MTVPVSSVVSETICAQVISGYGRASKDKLSSEHARLFAKFLEGDNVPGTLNVVFDRPVRFSPEHVAFSASGEGNFWMAEINELPCIVNRENRRPLHHAELISTVKLRDKLRLSDGD